jgi:hypothetical protein
MGFDIRILPPTGSQVLCASPYPRDVHLPLVVMKYPDNRNMAVQQPEPVQGASPVPAYTADPTDEKFQSQHAEYEKVEVKVDYSGAAAKTSPEEKKLVRKLDIWIMVS